MGRVRKKAQPLFTDIFTALPEKLYSIGRWFSRLRTLRLLVASRLLRLDRVMFVTSRGNAGGYKHRHFSA